MCIEKSHYNSRVSLHEAPIKNVISSKLRLCQTIAAQFPKKNRGYENKITYVGYFSIGKSEVYYLKEAIAQKTIFDVVCSSSKTELIHTEQTL